MKKEKDYSVPKTREERVKKLEECVKTLKSEFVGLDDIIDDIKTSISPWYITPEIIQRPTIISLWGMTGTGKTSVVRRITELLGLSGKAMFFDCGLEANDSSSSSIADKVCDTLGAEDFENDMDELSQDLVFIFDEFQYARTLDEAGSELLKSPLRPIWNIIDNGILNMTEYRYSIGYFANFVDDLTVFSTEHPDVEVVNGEMGKKEDIKELLNSIGLFYYGNRSNDFSDEGVSDEDENCKPIKIIEDSIFRTLIRKLNSYKPKYGYDTAKEILKKTNLNEIVEILKEAKKIVIAPKEMDCSKALVFILGNLDEAFHVEGDLSPDMDADIFYDITSKVTITDIKDALKKRFRAEQIARFGNNLIKYPTLKKEHFIQIIEKEMDRIFSDFQKIEGVRITYTPEIVELMYSEGVYPVQGVRPVFTTIGTMITPLLSDIVMNCGSDKEVVLDIYNKEDYTKRHFKMPYVCVRFIFPGSRYEYKYLKLQLGELRDPSKRKTRFINSVHEAGHAIVFTYLTGEFPSNIISVDTGHGGFVSTHIPEKEGEIRSKRDIDNEVMISLAGYEAEHLIYKDRPEDCLMGSGSDIEAAWETLSTAAYEDGYFAPYLFANFEVNANSCATPAGFSDKSVVGIMPGCIQELMKTTMKQLRSKTISILRDEMKLIVKMALYLGDAGSMSKKVYEEMIDKYGNKLTLNQISVNKLERNGWYWDRLLKLEADLGE